MALPNRATRAEPTLSRRQRLVAVRDGLDDPNAVHVGRRLRADDAVLGAGTDQLVGPSGPNRERKEAGCSPTRLLNLDGTPAENPTFVSSEPSWNVGTSVDPSTRSSTRLPLRNDVNEGRVGSGTP